MPSDRRTSLGRWNAIRGARVLSRTEAAGVRRKLSEDGLRLVFTNGCFDVVHPGHVHILRRARQLGDRLMVGVNTDDSVTRLKGHCRPLNDLAARLEVLSEFRSVDYLVPFDEDTPLELIRVLLPDVLVKGGDYTPETVAGADLVTSSGGRVVIVPLVGGYSSTGIIESLEDTDTP